jgi:hypothetical protein
MQYAIMEARLTTIARLRSKLAQDQNSMDANFSICVNIKGALIS